MQALANKAALVTGAGRGIGRSVARHFAKEGASVVVNDPGFEVDGRGFSPEPADSVVAEIVKAGGAAVACYESVATMDGGRRAVEAAMAAFGRLDAVATCHAILRDRMVFNMTEEEWDAVIRTNLNGTFAVCQHAAGLLREQRSGSIITFAAEAGLIGNSGQANYAASTSAIAGFTNALARELEEYGATANCVVPRADTRLTATASDRARGIRALRSIQQAREGQNGAATLDPEDIAPFVAYLASDIPRNVSGQTFLVHGRTISLMSQPRLTETLYKAEHLWTVEELLQVLPRSLCSNLENPAPSST